MIYRLGREMQRRLDIVPGELRIALDGFLKRVTIRNSANNHANRYTGTRDTRVTMVDGGVDIDSLTPFLGIGHVSPLLSWAGTHLHIARLASLLQALRLIPGRVRLEPLRGGVGVVADLAQGRSPLVHQLGIGLARRPHRREFDLAGGLGVRTVARPVLDR